jgi:hypothetical protein
MKRPIDNTALVSVLDQMGISDISSATIRQSGEIARALESSTGVEFLHLEMGIPGLPPEEIGVEAECAALRAGIASVYPNMMGIPELKTEASRFLKAFLDIDVSPRGCIPTVGSMQGSFSSFILCSHLDPVRDICLVGPGGHAHGLQLPDQVFRLGLRLAIVHAHGIALPCEPPGGLRPDATGSTGDEDSLRH